MFLNVRQTSEKSTPWLPVWLPSAPPRPLIELAKVDIELSKLINQFVEAKPRLKALIQEIELGASVLELLGGVSKQEEKDQICSANALDVANNIAAAYQKVFDELNKAVAKYSSSKDGDTKITFKAIMTWPVNEVKVNALLDSLERSKSNANIMLQVITIARMSKQR